MVDTELRENNKTGRFKLVRPTQKVHDILCRTLVVSFKWNKSRFWSSTRKNSVWVLMLMFNLQGLYFSSSYCWAWECWLTPKTSCFKGIVAIERVKKHRYSRLCYNRQVYKYTCMQRNVVVNSLERNCWKSCAFGNTVLLEKWLISQTVQHCIEKGKFS